MDEAWHQDRDQGRNEADAYRRVEVITGLRRRRNWTAAEKAEIVAASTRPDVSVSEVARRYGVNRSLLTVWRRQAGVSGSWPGDEGPEFAPLMVTEEGDGRRSPSTVSDEGAAARVEVALAAGRLVLHGPVDPSLAAALVGAMRRRP